MMSLLDVLVWASTIVVVIVALVLIVTVVYGLVEGTRRWKEDR